jgi:hypothetical protein
MMYISDVGVSKMNRCSSSGSQAPAAWWNVSGCAGHSRGYTCTTCGQRRHVTDGIYSCGRMHSWMYFVTDDDSWVSVDSLGAHLLYVLLASCYLLQCQ